MVRSERGMALFIPKKIEREREGWFFCQRETDGRGESGDACNQTLVRERTNKTFGC